FNSQEIIQHLKHSCPAHLYATSMSPPAVQQVISAIKVILGEDGSNRGTKQTFTTFLSFSFATMCFISMFHRIIIFACDMLQVPKNLHASVRIVISSGQSSRRWVSRFLVTMTLLSCP